MYSINRISRKNGNNHKLLERLKSKQRKTQIKGTILIILTITFLGASGKIFYMVNELLFFFIAYLTYDLTRNLNTKYMNIHLMIFAWFIAFFIFNSIYVIKDDRYFVLMAPPVAYFMIVGLSEISNKINIKFKNRNITFPVLAIILTLHTIIYRSIPTLFNTRIKQRQGSCK